MLDSKMEPKTPDQRFEHAFLLLALGEYFGDGDVNLVLFVGSFWFCFFWVCVLICSKH